MNARIRRITRDALLACVALIIFTFEVQLPSLSPIPGIKLGLSNIVTVYAVFTLSAADAGAILAVRILLGALVTGNVSALMYSAAGGAMCYIAMLLMRRALTEKQIWVASVVGAMAHNLGQIAVALLVTRTRGLLAYLPILEISGMIAGLFTGIAAQALIGRMRKR